MVCGNPLKLLWQEPFYLLYVGSKNVPHEPYYCLIHEDIRDTVLIFFYVDDIV